MNGKRNWVQVISILFITLFMLNGAASAAQLYVNNAIGNDSWDGTMPIYKGNMRGPKKTIQAGIDVSVDGDTISVTDAIYTGDGNRGISFQGKAITLKSKNGPESCIIDCQAGPSNRKRCFRFVSGETQSSVLDGFTIRNGYAQKGGGIYCIGSSPTITNCRITSNVGIDYGGGICCMNGSNPTITNCEITTNSSEQGRGGGIACINDSDLTIGNCTISDNSAHSGGGIVCISNSDLTIGNCIISGNTGSGIRCEGNSRPIITDCIISENVANDSGGGIFCIESSDPTITDCVISENTANDIGGGIYCEVSRPIVTNTMISGNSAIEGGGVYSDCRRGDFTNCIISNNSANSGGGFYFNDSSPTFANSIISGNSANSGGGFYFEWSSSSITNCTITDNTASEEGGGFYFYFCREVVIRNCILWKDSPDEIFYYNEEVLQLVLDYCDIQGGWSGEGSNNIDANPLLAPDGRLFGGSPCIDSGTEDSAPGDDIDGDLRPYDLGVDIGADEFVDSDLDGLGDWSETNIYLTDYLNPDTDFDGMPDGWEVRAGLDPLTDDADDDPDGDGRNNGDEYSADSNPLKPDNAEKTFYVDTVTGDDANDGLAQVWDGTHGPKSTVQAGIDATVTGWNYTVLVADGTYIDKENGAITFEGKEITVRSENGPEFTIIDCQANPPAWKRGFRFDSRETRSSVLDGFTITNGYSGRGGGIYCTGSNPTIGNCIVTGNQSKDGGGISCRNGGNPDIIDCLIEGNSAERGGGIESKDSSPTIRNCVITSNSAWYAGGINCVDGSPLIADSVISGNNAENYGGGIICYSSNAVITNCIITENACLSEEDTSAGGGIVCGSHYDLEYPESIEVSTEKECLTTGFLDWEVLITGCTISGNSATYGGGFCGSYATLSRCRISNNTADNGGGICSSGYIRVLSCQIAGNSARQSGGGLYLCRLYLKEITNCTIIENVARDGGGGIYCDDIRYCNVKNCILWGNAPDEVASYSNNPTLDFCNIMGGWSGPGSDNIEADPMLTPDGHLRRASPCIGWCPTGSQIDIDGEDRPFPVDGNYDIGADEFVDTDNDFMPDYWELKYFGSETGAFFKYDPDFDSIMNFLEYERGTHPLDEDTDGDGRSDSEEFSDTTNPLNPDNAEKTYYVNGTTGNDDYDGLALDWDGTHGPKATIQAGVDATVNGWDYTVVVADGTYTGEGNTFVIFYGKAITLRSANGPSRTVVDCKGTPESMSRGFKFVWNEDAASVLDGFTITNGFMYRGGGIRCYMSSPTIKNCIIKNNSAKSAGSGIYCIKNSNPYILNCLIIENHVNAQINSLTGGGISCVRESNPTIINCTIAGNTVAATKGASEGSICSSQYSNPKMINCILWNNGPDEVALSVSTKWTISYSDIQGGWSGAGSHNIDEYPMFVKGPLGDYYLSQIASGQALDSPCVDAGSATAESLGLHHLTTRTDGGDDVGIVDMGYHAPYAAWTEINASGYGNRFYRVLEVE